jgi:hypothetical protein
MAIRTAPKRVATIVARTAATTATRGGALKMTKEQLLEVVDGADAWLSTLPGPPRVPDFSKEHRRIVSFRRRLAKTADSDAPELSALEDYARHFWPEQFDDDDDDTGI